MGSGRPSSPRAYLERAFSDPNHNLPTFFQQICSLCLVSCGKSQRLCGNCRFGGGDIPPPQSPLIIQGGFLLCFSCWASLSSTRFHKADFSSYNCQVSKLINSRHIIITVAASKRPQLLFSSSLHQTVIVMFLRESISVSKKNKKKTTGQRNWDVIYLFTLLVLLVSCFPAE